MFLLNSGFLIEKADGNVRLWYLLHLQPKTPLPQALVKHIIKVLDALFLDVIS